MALDAKELSGSYNGPAPLQSAQPSASSPGMDTDLFCALSNAVKELGMEWSPPEEPSCSHMDEWFLPGCHQAPQQRASPFFPKVHDEITKSWRAPFSSHLRASSSSALTSVDGAEEKGYDSLPASMSQWTRIFACPQPLAGRQKPPSHLSHEGLLQLSLDKTIHRLDKRPRHCTPWQFCKCSRQNSSVQWTSLNPNPAAFSELHSATDLALHAIKMPAHVADPWLVLWCSSATCC